MLIVKKRVDELGITLIGPNQPGIITPGEAKLELCQAVFIYKAQLELFLGLRGCEANYDLGLGQSTCVGIGGDPICGTSFIDVLKMMSR